MKDNFLVARKTRGKIPRLPFQKMKEKVLGAKTEVSLAFVTPATSQALNKKLRKKNKPANILTFPFGKGSGEIIITPAIVKKEARLFGLTYEGFFILLFMHGLLHLKGEAHGRRMERQEEALARAFARASHLSYESPTHRNRY